MVEERLDLVAVAGEYGVQLTAVQGEQFAQYLALLQQWNAQMNLTRIISPRQVQIRHFLDSLTCAPVMGDLSGQMVVDMGTGAGFPGLPLKILYPDLRLTLVDSVAKKTQFLTAVVEALALTQVSVIASRAEQLGQRLGHREAYDWAVARSVAEMRVLAEYLLPLVRRGGQVLAQKGASAPEEVATATKAIHILGGGKAELTAVQLPEHELTHYLVRIPKERPTPPVYPRQPGKPTKRPL
jgi:16S rRNA (guanine527-N7)-methyltransferase